MAMDKQRGIGWEPSWIFEPNLAVDRKRRFGGLRAHHHQKPPTSFSGFIEKLARNTQV